MSKKTLIQIISLIGIFISIFLSGFISAMLFKMKLITKQVGRNDIFLIVLFCIIYGIWCWVGATLVDKFYKEKDNKK